MTWDQLTPSEKVYMPILSALMLSISGIMSGLTVGLFSIDIVRLRVAARKGDPTSKSRALRLLPLLDRSHLTLVTLLVTNTIAMIFLPIFLDEMFGPAVALVISVTALLFLGEVLPQSLFVRHNIAICSFFAYPIWFFVVITGIVSYPFAKLLDCVIHDTGEKLNRQRLREILAEVEAAPQSNPHEIRLMKGALALTEQKVSALRISNVETAFMLSTSEKLTQLLVKRLIEEGYSRIPVYWHSNRHQIVGCLILKTLVAFAFSQPEEPPAIGDLQLREPIRIGLNSTVHDLWESMRSGHSHIACVYDAKGTLSGFVTMEDIFEFLHACSYDDEDDVLKSKKKFDVDVSFTDVSHFDVSEFRRKSGGRRRSSAKSIIREKQLLAVYNSTREATTRGSGGALNSAFPDTHA